MDVLIHKQLKSIKKDYKIIGLYALRMSIIEIQIELDRIDVSPYMISKITNKVMKSSSE